MSARDEVVMLREMFPSISDKVLLRILDGNDWDLTVSIDAALAYDSSRLAEREEEHGMGMGGHRAGIAYESSKNRGVRHSMNGHEYKDVDADESHHSLGASSSENYRVLRDPHRLSDGGTDLMGNLTSSSNRILPKSSTVSAADVDTIHQYWSSNDDTPSMPTVLSTPTSGTGIMSNRAPQIHSMSSVVENVSHVGSIQSVTPTTMRTPASSLSSVKNSHESSRRQSFPIILSDTFLRAPRFRVTVDAIDEENQCTNFSVLFNRKNALLGMMIGISNHDTSEKDITTFDTDIIVESVGSIVEDSTTGVGVDKPDNNSSVENKDRSIRSVHRSNGRKGTVTPSRYISTNLARDAGIRVGDILTGVNDEYFSTGTEISEVLSRMHGLEDYLTLHFRRYRRGTHHATSRLSLSNRFNLHDEEEDMAEFHKFAELLMDQNVISSTKANYVTKCIERARDRLLQWDSGTLVEKAGKATSMFAASNTGNVFENRSSFDTREGGSGGRMSFDGSMRRSSIGSNTGRESIDMITLNTEGLRPALSAHIVQAVYEHKNSHGSLSDSINMSNLDSYGNDDNDKAFHVVRYKIWVMDVCSGKEWFIKKRFSEFFDFRDALIAIRKTVASIDFPPKRLSAANDSQVHERLFLLQKFLRKVCALISVNSLHPTSAAFQKELQTFLGCDDHILPSSSPSQIASFSTSSHQSTYPHDTITCNSLQDSSMDMVSQEHIPGLHYIVSRMHIFVHAILQISVMDRVIDSFLDKYLDAANMEQALSSKKREKTVFTQQHVRTVLSGLSSFLHDFHGVVYDGLESDCQDIFRSLRTALRDGTSGLDLLTVDDSGGNKESATVMSPEVSLSPIRLGPNTPSNTTPMYHQTVPITPHNTSAQVTTPMTPKSMSSEDRQRALVPLHSIADYEIAGFAKEVTRKQVEMEVYIACSPRVFFLLSNIYRDEEDYLQNKIQTLLRQPQSFFGIKQSQVSPTNWNKLVLLMRNIRNDSILMQCRLKALISICKEVPELYKQERACMRHSESVSVTHVDTGKAIDYESGTSMKEGREADDFGADDFLPIFIYILVQSRLPNLLVFREELVYLIDPEQKISESGYYVATLEAAIEYINNYDPTTHISGHGATTIFGASMNNDDNSDHSEKEDNDESYDQSRETAEAITESVEQVDGNETDESDGSYHEDGGVQVKLECPSSDYSHDGSKGSDMEENSASSPREHNSLVNINDDDL